MHPQVSPHDNQTRSGERGAIAVLMAVMLTFLMAAGMWGANAVSMSAVRREAQKAADLSALSGAAATPLVGLLAAGEPQATACERADALLTDVVAPMTGSLAAAPAPTCVDGVTVELHGDFALVDTVRAALAQAIDQAGLDVPDICDPVVAPLLDPALTSLTDVECASLQGAIDGLPDNVAPAVFTPRVWVRVDGTYEAPIPLPEFAGEHPISAEAEARRRFKNVVVLPAVRVDTLTGLIEPVAGFDPTDGVPMPFDEINPNPEAASVRDALLPALWDANDALTNLVNPLVPPGYEFSLAGLIQDVGDIYDPPRTATPPSPLDVAAEAAAAGEPVILLRLFRMPILNIPALDFTAAYLTPLADGSFQAIPIPVSQLSSAEGLFGASLVQ